MSFVAADSHGFTRIVERLSYVRAAVVHFRAVSSQAERRALGVGPAGLRVGCLQPNSTMWTSLGPWTPVMSFCSMSPERLGPEMMFM